MPLNWDELELAARSAAAAGGFAAMGYYRSALANASVLGEEGNPTTEADVQATLAIIRSLDPVMRLIAAKNDCGRSYFAEELAKADKNEAREKEIIQILGQLGGFEIHVKRSVSEFVASFKNSIATLFDALDGTANFAAGIPLFCCAVAFFIEGRPRVGAIHDPHHNVVYYGSLRGEGEGRAYMWQVQSGNNTTLPGPRILDTELIGTHLTRTDSVKRQEFIDVLMPLSQKSLGGIYMLNCGQLALAYVASGNLSAFVNNHTHIWDVAAGEVLIRAIGGKVTDFEGKPLKYANGDTRTEIVAALSDRLHEEIIGICRKVKPRK
jgi:fructose-1,6-bisphosphatase/inositol monophosphatase family enzyme